MPAAVAVSGGTKCESNQNGVNHRVWSRASGRRRHPGAQSPSSSMWKCRRLAASANHSSLTPCSGSMDGFMSLVWSLRRSLHSSCRGPAVHGYRRNKLMIVGSTSPYSSSSRFQCTSNDGMANYNSMDKDLVAFFDACRRPIVSKSVT